MQYAEELKDFVYIYVEKKVLEYNGTILTRLTGMFDYVD